MDYFAKLGTLTRSLWRERNRDERTFSAVAEEALSAMPPRLSVQDVVREFTLGEKLPPQTSSDFGQPPLVMWQDERFRIEVLFWLDGTTSIHQHSFSGAFHVLAGSSVHATYAFSPHERIHSRMRLGQLSFLEVELLTAGHTRSIVAGQDFIHALFHLERPSVTVVVRTHQEPDFQPQFLYLKPYVAYAGLAVSPQLEKQLQLLDMLQKTQPDLELPVLRDCIAKSDFETAFRFLWKSYGSLSERGEFDDILSVARKRHGERVDLLLPVLEEQAWMGNITGRRDEVPQPDHRFLLALLLNVPTRKDILRLVQERSGGDPLETVMTWTEQLTHVTDDGSLDLLGLELAPDSDDFGKRLPEAFFAIFRAMLEGKTRADIGRQLGERFSPIVVERNGDGIDAVCESLKASPFRPLLLEP